MVCFLGRPDVFPFKTFEDEEIDGVPWPVRIGYCGKLWPYGSNESPVLSSFRLFIWRRVGAFVDPFLNTADLFIRKRRSLVRHSRNVQVSAIDHLDHKAFGSL